jgi:DNA-binding NarL/FixJ family response regulator
MFRTLLVEDAQSFRAATREMLKSHFPFMEVDEASSGSQALYKLGYLEPDLVFMDIKLPDTNGVGLTKDIKLGFAGVIVVILSSYDIPEYRQAAFRAGADCFISKDSPTCMEEILARVKGALFVKKISLQ